LQKFSESDDMNQLMGNDIQTEWENMQINGYDRAWDCGHKKFIWESDIPK